MKCTTPHKQITNPTQNTHTKSLRKITELSPVPPGDLGPEALWDDPGGGGGGCWPAGRSAGVGPGAGLRGGRVGSPWDRQQQTRWSDPVGGRRGEGQRWGWGLGGKVVKVDLQWGQITKLEDPLSVWHVSKNAHKCGYDFGCPSVVKERRSKPQRGLTWAMFTDLTPFKMLLEEFKTWRYY